MIRQNFLDEDIVIPKDLSEVVSQARLVDMIDFKRTSFDKAIKTNAALKINIESKYDTIPLKRFVLEINPSKDEFHGIDGKTLASFVEMSSLGFGTIDNKVDRPLLDMSSGGYTNFRENDVLVAKITPCMENGKCALAENLTNQIGFGSTEFHVIRAANKERAKYVLEFINREYIRKVAASNMTGASGHRRVPQYFYEQMPIPDAPQDIIEKIVNECEAVDKEVEEARIQITKAKELIGHILGGVNGETKTLRTVAPFATGRIDFSSISVSDYITTDNMLQHFEGVRPYEGEPQTGNVTEYKHGDILMSNIRPYLKKLWLADRNGGCNPDVIVFRPTSEVLPEFVYYMLCRQAFIDYVMSDVKGMKMPRGNKDNVIRYAIPVPQIEIQQQIVEEISAHETKIAEAKAVINSSAERKQAILDKYLKDNK